MTPPQQFQEDPTCLFGYLSGGPETILLALSDLMSGAFFSAIPSWTASRNRKVDEMIICDNLAWFCKMKISNAI